MGSGDNLAEVPWAGLFCGRAAELAQLSSAYARVEAGGGPEAVVVLGESGLGKTRLVQEFFGRLSSQVDAAGAAGYWPDRLVRGGNNLAINPDPADCNPSNLAQMRFLWWGIRMLDRQGHNAGLGGVSDSITFLRAHLEPFARAKLLGARMKQAATGAAVDIAVEVANLFTFGLIGLGKLGVDHAREWKGILDERGASSTDSPAAQEEQQRESLIEVTLRDLGVLFEASEKKGAHLPAVILLDDAQWLGEDESTTTFFARLLRKAEAENWPLLLVATHWEKEWHDGEADASAASLPALLRNYGADAQTVITLGKEPDLISMVETAFPGLKPLQTKLLLDKAGGNPRLLDEMLRYLLRKRGFFEGRNPENALTERGVEQVKQATFALHDLIADRLASAPPSVQKAVGLASLQGERFIKRLAISAAMSLGGNETDAAEALAQANRPYALVSWENAEFLEFMQRVYRDVALEHLPDIIDPDDADEAMREALRNLADEDGKFSGIDGQATILACDSAIRFLGEKRKDPKAPFSDRDAHILFRSLAHIILTAFYFHGLEALAAVNVMKCSNLVKIQAARIPESWVTQIVDISGVAARLGLDEARENLRMGLAHVIQNGDEETSDQNALFHALTEASQWAQEKREFDKGIMLSTVLVSVAQRLADADPKLRIRKAEAMALRGKILAGAAKKSEASDDAKAALAIAEDVYTDPEIPELRAWALSVIVQSINTLRMSGNHAAVYELAPQVIDRARALEAEAPSRLALVAVRDASFNLMIARWDDGDLVRMVEAGENLIEIRQRLEDEFEARTELADKQTVSAIMARKYLQLGELRDAKRHAMCAETWADEAFKARSNTANLKAMIDSRILMAEVHSASGGETFAGMARACLEKAQSEAWAGYENSSESHFAVTSANILERLAKIALESGQLNVVEKHCREILEWLFKLPVEEQQAHIEMIRRTQKNLTKLEQRSGGSQESQ